MIMIITNLKHDVGHKSEAIVASHKSCQPNMPRDAPQLPTAHHLLQLAPMDMNIEIAPQTLHQKYCSSKVFFQKYCTSKVVGSNIAPKLFHAVFFRGVASDFFSLINCTRVDWKADNVETITIFTTFPSHAPILMKRPENAFSARKLYSALDKRK